MKNMKLRNGLCIPSIGLGTWKITDRQEIIQVLANAYENGYRLIDTAAAYMNEMAIGKALKELQIPREEWIIQDKLWNTCYGYEEAQEACKRSLRKLKTDYLDIYLIHWPATAKQYSNWQEINAETWRGLEQLYKEGYVKAIGVCNFKPHHLMALGEFAQICPFLNQIEFHPGMLQEETVSYCNDKGIQIEASSPLGNGQILKNDVLTKIAKQMEVSVAQICLKWALKRGAIIIPKTTRSERMRENMQLDEFDLSDEQMQQINQLPFLGGLRIDADEVTNFEGL